MDRIELLGVQIDNLSWEEALERIHAMILSGEPHHIVTPAIEQVVRARRDPEFYRVYNAADLVVADGMQIVFASRWHKTPLKDRITGVDLIPAICRLAAREGYSVYFLGGKEGVAAEAAQRLQNEIPSLRVAGVLSPPFGFDADPAAEAEAIKAVRQARPDVLFVAMRSPRMETWIDRRKQELGVPVMIGIGGAFDFITGREKRAPQWMQRLGMEGLHRFLHRPRDIGKRLLAHAPYFFFLLADRFTYRTQKRAASCIRPAMLALGDAALGPLCFLFSYWLYFRSGIFPNAADPFPERALLDMPAYSDLLIFVSILGVLSMGINRLYRRDKYAAPAALALRLLKVSFMTVFLLIGFQFVFKDIFKPYNFRGFSRVVFGFFALSYFSALFLWREAFRRFEFFLHKSGFNLDRIIVVGTNRSACEIAEAMTQRPEWGNLPLGFLSTAESPENPNVQAPIIGEIRDLQRLLPARKVDEVLIADNAIPMSGLLEIVEICRKNRVTLSIIPTIHELLGVSSEIKRIGDYRVITVTPSREIAGMLSRGGKTP
ncbi:MAG: WecB/TagA/CpsF family glycosyltransferase [Candidatus Omnitrophota bacterium]